jgi:hypothetical protein
LQPWHYIVLLGAVLLVFAFLKPSSRQPAKPATTIKEIEDTMEQFTAELEEENRQLIQLVSEMKHDHEKHSAKLQGRLEVLERQNIDVSKQLDRLLQAEANQRNKGPAAPAIVADPAAAKLAAAVAASSSAPTNPLTEAPPVEKQEMKPDGMNIRNRYTELFQLEKQGKSIDHIAKKLGMNKGEVMLIIQLAKQEDHARA